eukprot:CAMPEP_0185788448 /NCGR_PEP_ID=MMETSP1174-20130828/146093_1 /TAXON_ID=35687 /ORGANISM="Dictyocha speculum, Strain CCMP1381" /LENGTH=204 /DNA_ID=CAMNT_0028482137 /DNA_START=18 /DNA_END=632 /DNA_ORIENTATION=+
MTQGVGILRKLHGQDTAAISNAVTEFALYIAKNSNSPPVRVTMVSTNYEVVLVEEWITLSDYSKYELENPDRKLENFAAPLVSKPPTTEFFPISLHISKGDKNPGDIGILVRQKSSGEKNGRKLRDAQREAYERQMALEPGCTCCIILAGSSDDISQVRIIELWRTMNDFYVHENSEWHARGEEKVVPLVIDMDCDFCRGTRIN